MYCRESSPCVRGSKRLGRKAKGFFIPPNGGKRSFSARDSQTETYSAGKGRPSSVTPPPPPAENMTNRTPLRPQSSSQRESTTRTSKTLRRFDLRKPSKQTNCFRGAFLVSNYVFSKTHHALVDHRARDYPSRADANLGGGLERTLERSVHVGVFHLKPVRGQSEGPINRVLLRGAEGHFLPSFFDGLDNKQKRPSRQKLPKLANLATYVLPRILSPEDAVTTKGRNTRAGKKPDQASK